MPQLDTSTYSSQLFWLVICITFFYFFIVKVFIPNIEFVLKERQKKITSLLDDAKKLQQEAILLNNQYAEEIKKVHLQAYHAHQTALKDLDKKCEEQNANIKALHEKHINELISSIKTSEEEFLSQIESKAEYLAEKMIDVILLPSKKSISRKS
ncbi:MAG: hypothetical protein SFT68_02735 [Rickettsiaceae bacterium]|nr:hypothetical protein [Rickettsiaceae bacterium]